ncbi:MAG: YihY/virulence factor BrkB family protein [Steroidobacteraceae bacterium]
MVYLKRTAALGSCAARYWFSDSASTTGAALAFYCAFSLAPLLIILITVSGWFVGTTAAYDDIQAQLTSLFGPSTARILVVAAKASQQGEGLVATVLSIVTLLIGATSVLAALESALQQIWQSAALARSGVLGWLRTRFLSLGFILALGFLLLVSLTVSTALANVRLHVVKHHAALVGTIGLLDFLASLLLVSLLFAMIYRYMPARRLPWRVVFTGGVLTALLFDAGRWAIGLYLAHSTQPLAFGAAASFAALLLWLYYTAQIFLFGAEFTACLGGVREGDKRQSAASRLALGLAAK